MSYTIQLVTGVAWLLALGAPGALAMPTHECGVPIPHLPPLKPLCKEDHVVAHPEGKYETIRNFYFEAWPHSKVPMEPIVLMMVVFVFSILFLLLTGLCIMLNRFPITPRGRALNKDREMAFANLRVLGIPNEIPQPSEKPTEEREPSPEESGESEKAEKRVSVPPRVSTDSTKKKGKDANMLSGPVVPVLRSDAPVLDSENEEDEEEEVTDEEDAQDPNVLMPPSASIATLGTDSSGHEQQQQRPRSSIAEEKSPVISSKRDSTMSEAPPYEAAVAAPPIEGSLTTMPHEQNNHVPHATTTTDQTRAVPADVDTEANVPRTDETNENEREESREPAFVIEDEGETPKNVPNDVA